MAASRNALVPNPLLVRRLARFAAAVDAAEEENDDITGVVDDAGESLAGDGHRSAAGVDGVFASGFVAGETLD